MEVCVKTNKLLFAVIALFIILSSSVYSQLITSSTIREDIEIWKPLDNPILISSDPDDPWGQILMPFTFLYDNTSISYINAYGNGFISLNRAYNPDGSSMPSFPQNPMIISWYNRNLFTTGSFSYQVSGTAPFRVLTVQQLGARVVTDLSGNVFDVQVKFFETTNEVKIIYNRYQGLGGAGVDGYLFFAGNLSGSEARYINIKPNNPLSPATLYYSTSNKNITPFLTKDNSKYFYSGRSFTLTSTPKISGIYPDNSTLLASGNVYTDDQHPFVRVSRADGQKPITIRYKITGPLGTPQSQVIYTAIDSAVITSSEKVNPNPQPIGTAIRVKMPHAKNIAGRLSDGALDLSVASNFPSGEYRVDATLEYLDGTPYTNTASSIFTVTFPSDIALTGIIEPVYNLGSIYPVSGVGIPVKILVKNQGANPVSKFVGSYKILNSSNSVVSQVSEEFDLSSEPLQFGESREMYFTKKFYPNTIGVYSVETEINFDDPTKDKYMANNVFPRPGDPKKLFEVAYFTEAQLDTMLNPNTTYKNKPIRVNARLKNNGVSNITMTWASVKITDPDGIVVKEDTTVVEEIPSGIVNTSSVIWPEPFIPAKIGTYHIKFYIFAQDDELPSNNSYETTIEVKNGLNGNYIVSKNNGDFATITDAINALYDQGVVGPVKFLLSDTEFNEGDILSKAPALNFSTKIIGASASNPITFTVNPQISGRGAVHINLSSASGIGIYFGQSITPGNIYAGILNVTSSMVKNYANNDGYITFDGATNKSLFLTIKTSSPFRTVFYLGNGSHHISVKNCLIEDGVFQSPSYTCKIPATIYNQPFDRYDYEADNNVGGSYSAGIVVRNIPPFEASLGINVFGLDTLLIHDVVLSGNEIRQFGYGIVSLGIGSLNNLDKQAYLNYYNQNNKFVNNTISLVSRAGIYLGYEKSSEVSNNRIFDVSGICGNDVAGIILGGDLRTGYFGYNNIGIQVSGNEISGIKGSNNLYGIKIEQSLNKITTPEGVYTFPDEDENIRLVNNIVWGFEPSNANPNIIGLGLFTSRKNSNNWSAMDFEPADKNYVTKNDIVSNNTIFLSKDNYSNKGAIVGTALMNTQGINFVNNAISISDDDITPTNPTTAAVLFYGLHPKTNSISSDRNAFWVNNTNAAIYRFIETDASGKIVEQGSRREFATLDQWQQWTKQDWNSVYGNIANDYEMTGAAPYKFRVKSNPTPIGSLLNNRGSETNLNKVDIDGKLRGEAGERYDIGAVEFKGRINKRDLEVVVMPKPGAYKATEPAPFNDANYIMTTSPVGVNTIVRNNGLLVSSAVSATLKIYRETSIPGTYVQEGPTISGPIEGLLFSEDITLDFLTDDGINQGDNYEFYPKTYGDLRSQGYIIPDQFKAMEANVTPLYKFVVEVPTDDYNANNKIEKIVRFYIRKSPVRLMVSAADIPIAPISGTSSLNTIASKLNLDSLTASFKRLGWYVNLDLEDPRVDIDIFDRKQWEPRSINYPIYRSLFWVDGDDNLNGAPYRLSRYDRDHITNFLNSGSVSYKKNLVVSSQDIARNESVDFADWVTNTLFVKPKASPTSALGDGVTYDGEYLKGVILGKEKQFLVKKTDFAGDALPYPATNTINNPGTGNTYSGMTYAKFFGDIPTLNYYVPASERIASFPTTYVNYNVVYTGVEWRHFGNIDDFLRGTFDFLTYYEGYVVPVNLLSFNATAVANRVELNWETASEQNSDRFVVEKSIVTESGKTDFETVETVASVGNSNILTKYGPIIDTKVSANNSYIYRLKMYDRNGEFKYSDEQVVTLDGIYGSISIEGVNPNPANNFAKLSVHSNKLVNANITLVDINGNEVMSVYNGNIDSGFNSFDINTNKLSNGVYTIVINVDGQLITTKLNVVK